jgi:hypothetical protein
MRGMTVKPPVGDSNIPEARTAADHITRVRPAPHLPELPSKDKAAFLSLSSKATFAL